MTTPDLAYVSNLLMDQYNNSKPVADYVSNATAGINNQSNKAIRDLFSRFANNGMSRSGISGVAANDIYSQAGQNINKVAAQGEVMQQQNQTDALQQLVGLAKYKDQKSNYWAQFLGQLIGAGGQIGAAAIGA